MCTESENRELRNTCLIQNVDIPQKRTATRRAHDSLSKHSLSECPNCHEQKLPHRACPKCGTYKGREILEVAEKS